MLQGFLLGRDGDKGCTDPVGSAVEMMSMCRTLNTWKYVHVRMGLMKMGG